MRQESPKKTLTVPDRLAIAALVTTFLFGGHAAASELYPSDSPVFFFGGSFLGAIFARALIGGARHIYGSVVVIAAWMGLYAGIATRPGAFWQDRAFNLGWDAAWTFAAAIAATLWTRREEAEARTRTWAIVMMVVLGWWLPFLFGKAVETYSAWLRALLPQGR